jgi:hypothetical protein
MELLAKIIKELDELEIENFVHKFFIPLSTLEALFPRERVVDLLGQHNIQFYDRDEVANAILANGLRLFATLVTIQEVEAIEGFIKADNFSGGNFDLKLPLNEASLASVFKESPKRIKFVQKQWRFLAPVLREDQSHRVLDDRTILPFLSSENIGKGGFANVSKVRVDASHHKISGAQGEVSLPPCFLIYYMI